MEYRKLISFGKSSFVVSLPKSWITKQKLNKGDTIYFEEKEDNLLLTTQEKRLVPEEKEITILVDGKNISQIQRELIPAYINNFKTIILSGKEIKDKAKEIEPVIQNLIALEIMEQTANKIVARDFLDMENISINNLIRKMDVIVRAMFEDSLNMFREDTYENINHRDKDVNRLSYLIFRVINYGLKNQAFMNKKFKLTALDLMRYYLLVFHIEAIADEVRRTARYMKLVKLSKNKQNEFVRLFLQARDNYLETLKAFYTHNIELAHSIAERKKKLMDHCENFYIKNQNTVWVAYLVDRLKRMVNTIHKLGRIVYE